MEEVAQKAKLTKIKLTILDMGLDKNKINFLKEMIIRSGAT